MIPDNYPISIHAVSGYSGGGRAAVDAFESGDAAARTLPLQIYGLALEHKHVPEIRQHAGLAHRPFGVPAYGAYLQGSVLTIPIELRLLPAGVTGERLHACLAHHYADARHVDVMPLADTAAATHLDPQALNGTNDLRLGVFVNANGGQVLLSAVFDNLGKGASGAAVQNLDLMLGARHAA